MGRALAIHVDGIAGLANLILVAAVGALAAARHIGVAWAHWGMY